MVRSDDLIPTPPKCPPLGLLLSNHQSNGSLLIKVQHPSTVLMSADPNASCSIVDSDYNPDRQFPPPPPIPTTLSPPLPSQLHRAPIATLLAPQILLWNSLILIAATHALPCSMASHPSHHIYISSPMCQSRKSTLQASINQVS